MGQQWERSLFCQFQLLGSYWKVHWLKLAPGLEKVQWGKPTPPNIFFRPILPNFEKKLKSETMILGGGPCSQSVRQASQVKARSFLMTTNTEVVLALCLTESVQPVASCWGGYSTILTLASIRATPLKGSFVFHQVTSVVKVSPHPLFLCVCHWQPKSWHCVFCLVGEIQDHRPVQRHKLLQLVPLHYAAIPM